jgi:hypothetical protein
MEIARILQHSWDFELASFSADVYYSFLFSTEGQVCWGIGWDLDAINFIITSDLILKDCYKTIFYDICDFSTSWTGDYAQWIEECDDSTSASTTIMDKSWPAVSGQNTLGGVEDSGIGCF